MSKTLSEDLYMALHPASAVPDVPHAIHSASQGNFGPLQWAIESLEGYSENVATGVYYSLDCCTLTFLTHRDTLMFTLV